MTPVQSVQGLSEELKCIRTAAVDVQVFTAELDDAAIISLPDNDRRTFRALQDALAEISERVGGLPPEVANRHPDVDWCGWTGLRLMLPRQSSAPGLNRLHPVITHDIPALLAAVEAELASQTPASGVNSATDHEVRNIDAPI